MQVESVIALCVTLLVGFGCGVGLYAMYAKNMIYAHANEELKRVPSYGDKEKEWANLSKSGKDPLRVIALAKTMSKSMDPFRKSMHMASSFYSQIKFLLRRWQFFDAAVYYLEARKWSDLALEQWHTAKDKNPIDLEVIGALDFAVAKKVPVIGLLLFKKRAMMFLLLAEQEIDEERRNGAYPHPLTGALIWSKLYALTGNIKYYFLVLAMAPELTSKMDPNTLARIAGHMGFDTVDQLLQFCNH